MPPTVSPAVIAERAIDVVVAFNAIWVGLEVDAPEIVSSLKDVVPVLFCLIYIGEFAFRFISDAQGLILRFHVLKAEFCVVLIAILGVFVFPDKPHMWRFSVFRLVRGLRVIRQARGSVALADLWLVLASMGRGSITLGWLVLVFFLSTLIAGIATRGFIYAGDTDDLTNAVCGGDDFRYRMKCIDISQYFGSLYKSSVTMMQIATLDRWAAHVVRPLFGMRPLAGIFVIFFVIVTAYGLLSIAVGVLVWSTVETAKLHDTHRDRVAVVQDKMRIHHLKEYFARALELEDRESLDFREIKEAMSVKPVKQAYDELDLPVTDLQQLWSHLDSHNDGEISLDQFEHGCVVLLEPAKRFDMASLSAQLAGRAEFAGRLSARCDVTIDEMDDLFAKLTSGFARLRSHVLSKDINELFPEVSLRRAGKMKIPHPTGDD